MYQVEVVILIEHQVLTTQLFLTKCAAARGEN